MIVLTILLYTIGIAVLILLALFLFVLFTPVRYSFSGQYNKFIAVNYKVNFSPLLRFRGNWESAAGNPNQMQVVFAGFTFNIDPDKIGAEKEKPEKKKKDSPKLPLAYYLGSYDRAVIKNGLETVKDILNILLPGKIELNGRVGFDEPHLTGWLASVNSIVRECTNWSWFNVEPVWNDEHYEMNFLVEGRLVIFTILLRAARFILARRTIKLLWRMKKEKAHYTAEASAVK